MRSHRIQVFVTAAERERMRAQARREGRSLSEWLREAGEQRLRDAAPDPLDSPEALRTFFAVCDDRETTGEADWQQHLGVMAWSRACLP